MYQSKSIELFGKLVKNKFDIYSSLFLNLPYSKGSNIGMLIPLLYQVSKKGLDAGENPQEILDAFFRNHTNVETEKEKTDFMFKVIHYVERQVVLFDSVEDAAFPKMHEYADDLTINDFFQLLDSQNNWDKIAEKLSTFSARIVFTAHPTQFYTPSVLDIINTLRSHIKYNQIDDIDMTLQQLGLTSLINSKKPTPLDEAKNIIYFLRDVYYHAVGNLYSDIKENIRGDDFDNTNIIKLGFWPGGDRDGNPFVTSETTMDVADELRMTLIKCYYHDVKNLQHKLTFKEVEDTLTALRDKLYSTMFDPAKTMIYEEIINPLYAVRDLVVNNYHSLYLKDLDAVIGKVNIFRVHFATMDIRQDHRIHKKAVETILKKEKIISESLEELGREELIRILLHKKIRTNAHSFKDELIQDTIRNITQLKIIQSKNGEEGCNRYVISNSEDIFSVLFVYGLFRWCGWAAGKITFDIIPLFETMVGLDSSEKTIQELFDIPEYRAHLSQRYDKQTIMLGFSDGTKDGGYLRANWSIFKTKEKLSAVCEQNSIKAIFFDGRGGPPARGGGKSHRFYAAQSAAIANHEIQLTIQGQTITSTYGTEEQFIHNFEQLLTAGLSRNFLGKEQVINDKERELLNELADISFKKYKELKEHEMFIPYLENKSALKYYDQANIGSRPGKRGDAKKLELTDLRAISFVGSWSQLKQNVPGFFGVGTAIEALINRGKLEELKMMFKEVPFFKTLVLNSMMSLSKCYFELTSYLKEDPEYKEFWNILFDEYKLSNEMLLLVSNFTVLMEEEPVTMESIKIREKIVLPLLVIQQYALQKIGQDTSNKAIYEKLVTRSLYGNINASRNSV
ncbi:phosphoenolpyruvate carboxylase [Bacteroidota bacterium]